MANGPTNGHSKIRGPLKAISRQPVEERQPPHDLGAEAALLSTMLLEDTNIERARSLVTSGDFFSSSHALIFDAALEVGKADVVLVASHLKDHDRLAQVGGMSYVTEVLNAAPAVANMQRYADIIRRHSRERQLLVLGHHMVAELYALKGANSGKLIADLKTQLEILDKELLGLEPGISFLPHDDLWKQDPPEDLVVPGLGLCAGPPTGLFGQGYSGKSVAAFAMGMAIAIGKDVWGVYSAKEGRWVHLDYEQGKKRSKALVQRLAKGFGVDRRELTDGGRFDIAIYPDVTLTSSRAVDAYARAMDGATICTADALKGMTPSVDENSSEMRDHMGVLRLASEKTGCMVVLIHHAGKTPQDGARPRKEAGRGSSAIFDECQSVFVLSGKKGEPTTVSHEKDRVTGLTVDDFGLLIRDVPTDDGNPRGGLQVVHLDPQQLGRNGGSDGERSFARKKQVVKEAIAKNPGVGGTGVVSQMLSMRKSDVADAVSQLVAEGEVVTVPAGRNAQRLYIRGTEPSR